MTIVPPNDIIMIVTKDNRLAKSVEPDKLTIEDVKAYLLVGCIIRQVPYNDFAASGIKRL